MNFKDISARMAFRFFFTLLALLAPCFFWAGFFGFSDGRPRSLLPQYF
jgi:hypothetical protein